MEDDDDLYGDDAPPVVKAEDSDNDGEAMDEELESGEEEESSDSDVEFVLEKKETEPLAPPPNRYGAVKQEQGRATPVDAKAQQQTNGKAGQPQATPVSQKLADGSTYPEQRTSTVDVNVNPVYEPVGKPITQVDIEADLAEHTKPWRLPGSDPSDYFNYGFDEFTWTQYVLRQQGMGATLEGQQAETQQFQQMFGGGMPGMPAAPSGPMAAAPGGNMPGMPNEQEFMQMAQMMMASGQDPSQMDFNTFMQQANGGGAGAGGGFGGQNQGQGQGNFNNSNYGGQNQGHGGGGGGGGGRGRRGGGRW